MAHGKFGTAINCIDGRVQLPVMAWMKEQYHLDYVDMITEPGPDKILATESREIASIKNRVMISVNAHGSRIVLIAGHYDCAGNPVGEEEHKAQLKKAVPTILSWDLPLKDIVAVWINQDWKIEIVASSQQ